MNKTNSWYRFAIVLAIALLGAISFPKIYKTVFPPKQVGTWEGLNYANQKITFAMKNENEIFITFGNETASGTYKIDESKQPNWIDIYFTDAKDAKDAKGIIEFMDNNTLRIQLTDHVAKPRPTMFNQKE